MPTQIGSAYGQIIIDHKGAVAGIGQVQRGLGGLQKGFLGLNPVMAATGLGLAGIAATGGAVAAVIGTGTDKAADLQEQLSGVKAVTGATVEQMDGLRSVIDELAIDPNLKVSTFEAADALELLGRNGLTVQEIMDGAARSTVLLANATGADFGKAADIGTDAMALFNIEARDMERAVDGITAVVNNSKFSIDDYRLALAQGGGVAAATGVEFNDFNTAIAGIAPLFASGSDAGTSFKVMLQRLVPASKPAKAAMQELGIITEDGANQFFDAAGNLKSMTEIAGILENALAGLSEEQRNQALSTIFGTDAMRAAVGLANLGAEGFERLQATMGETSAAENAATRMDNLRGSLEILGGVVEAIQIRIGDAFIPQIKEGAEDLTDFLSENADSIVAFFEGLARGAGAAKDAVKPLLPIALDLARYILAVIESGDPLNDWLTHLPESVRPFAEALGNLLALGKETLPEMVADVKNFATDIVNAFNEGGFEGVGKLLWERLFGGADVTITGQGVLDRVIDFITNYLSEKWPDIAAKLDEWSRRFWDWADSAAERSGESLTRLAGRIQSWADDPATQERLRAMGLSLGMAMIDGLELLLQNDERIRQFFLTLLKSMALASLALTPALLDVGDDIAGGVLAGILQKVSGEETSAELTEFMGNLWRGVIMTLIMTLLPGLGIAFAIGQFNSIRDQFNELDFKALGRSIVERIADGLRSAIGKIREAVGDILDEFNPLRDVELPDWLTPGSPTPLETGLRGISDAIQKLPDIGAAFSLPQAAEMTAGRLAAVSNIPQQSTLTGGGGQQMTIEGDLVIEIPGAQDPINTAKAVRRSLSDLFDLVPSGAF